MGTTLILILLALGAAAAYVFFLRKAERSDTMRNRLEKAVPSFSSQSGMDYGPAEAAILNFDEDKNALAQTLEGLFSALGINAEARIKSLQQRMSQAGINSANGIIYYMFAKYIVLPAFALIAGIVVISALGANDIGGLMKVLYVIVGGFVAIVGVRGADLYIANRVQKRQKTLERSFPDALDLLLVCVESGLALDGALARVCKELGRAHPEVTDELNRTRMELTLLNDRSVALQNLASRTEILAFKSLVSALIQTEKFGTSLADTLRVLSEDYRLTRLMLAEQKAGRLPVLMTIPLITLLLPALVLVILAPPFIRVSAQGGLFGNK